MVNFKCSGKYLQVAFAWVGKVKTSKKVGREIASKEFVQDGPKKRAYDVMIDSVWKIATTKNAGKFIGLMHAVRSAPGVNYCL